MIGAGRRIVGIMCGNEFAARPIQAVATRFIAPLKQLCGASVLLVPAVDDACDAAHLAQVLDGLLLTGARSHMSPDRYGGLPLGEEDIVDRERDAVALRLAEAMIGAGKPVFGICRGLQEINVLFGGTLVRIEASDRHHHRGSWDGDYDDLFAHRHAVDLVAGGFLAAATDQRRLIVNSVHEQVVDRLGNGLAAEALACHDGAIEALRARDCGADVLAVQWHPEWDVGRCAGSCAFFNLFDAALAKSPRDAAIPVH